MVDKGGRNIWVKAFFYKELVGWFGFLLSELSVCEFGCRCYGLICVVRKRYVEVLIFTISNFI